MTLKKGCLIFFFSLLVSGLVVLAALILFIIKWRAIGHDAAIYSAMYDNAQTYIRRRYSNGSISDLCYSNITTWQPVVDIGLNYKETPLGEHRVLLQVDCLFSSPIVYSPVTPAGYAITINDYEYFYAYRPADRNSRDISALFVANRGCLLHQWQVSWYYQTRLENLSEQQLADEVAYRTRSKLKPLPREVVVHYRGAERSDSEPASASGHHVGAVGDQRVPP